MGGIYFSKNFVTKIQGVPPRLLQPFTPPCVASKGRLASSYSICTWLAEVCHSTIRVPTRVQ